MQLCKPIARAIEITQKSIEIEISYSPPNLKYKE